MQRTRKDRVAQLDLLDDDQPRTLSWSFMRLALVHVLAALAGLRCKFLSWRCAR